MTAPSPKQRLFVALPLPEVLVATAKQLVNQAREAVGLRNVRWVSPEQWHLTLRFLGPTPSSQVAALEAALDLTVREAHGFSLRLGRWGCFPGFKSPRVVWLGLEGALEDLQAIQRAVETGTKEFGHPPEDRSFHPHLTLGRVKASGPSAREVGAIIQSLPSPPMEEWPVKELLLIESVLSPRGAHYTTLRRWELAQ